MKTIKITLSNSKYFLLVLFVAFSFACSPEDGKDGAQGPTGAAGTDGQDGQNGNANVVNSGWLDANWNRVNLPTLKVMRIKPEEIDLDYNVLRDESLILIYMQQTGTTTLSTLPGSAGWSNVIYSYTFGDIDPDYSGILIRIKSTNGIEITEGQSSASRGVRFRYVIIPSAFETNSLDYSKITYEEVMNHFDLEL